MFDWLKSDNNEVESYAIETYPRTQKSRAAAVIGGQRWYLGKEPETGIVQCSPTSKGDFFDTYEAAEDLVKLHKEQSTNPGASLVLQENVLKWPRMPRDQPPRPETPRWYEVPMAFEGIKGLCSVKVPAGTPLKAVNDAIIAAGKKLEKCNAKH